MTILIVTVHRKVLKTRERERIKGEKRVEEVPTSGGASVRVSAPVTPSFVCLSLVMLR